MRYLFIFAHPDDEVDSGGTISQLSSSGHDVAVAIMVGKAAARRNLSETIGADERTSMGIIGVTKIYHADFPNIKINTVPHLDLVRYIESCISDWRAEAIVTHHTADVNIDHAVTGSAASAACRLFQRTTGKPRLKLFLYCESAGSTEWALDSSKNRFLPNYFIRIGRDGLETKLKAHNAYAGVPRPFPHPYSHTAYESLAAYRGAQAGLDYAEAFQCVFRSE